MPSTYSPSLKLELIGNGEQAGTWGTTTNLNLGTLLEQAITGVLPITLTGDVTLTDYNGLSDQARNAVLIFNGLLGAPCNVIAPPSQKVYIIRNRSNATVTIKTTSGNGISIANAGSEVVFCDGTDFYSATAFNYINGNLTVTGNTDLQGSVTMGSKANSSVVINANATSVVIGSKNVYGNSSTGQWYVPTGNTAARAATGTHGLIRYNSELQIYEGYANSNWVKFLVVNQGSYTINYVAVGGGGGGSAYGLNLNSGGGAGKVSESTTPAVPGSTVLTMTIGAGGAGGTAGSSSLITGIVDASTGQPGTSSGGTSGNGYAGGFGNGPFEVGGGGGGGAGAAGSNGSGGPDIYTRAGGAGGIGLETLITGTSQYFGGGGGGYGAASGAGGAGGGGAGGLPANNGTTNTGGGGGGPANGNLGGSGGSGVVFLSMPTVNYTGVTTGSPTITTTGSNTVLKYTGSGTYTG